MEVIDTNDETKISLFIEERGYIRRNDLIKEFDKKNNPNGYSIAKINRIIKSLERQGTIQILKKNDLISLSISNQDQNASYLIHKKHLKNKLHIDSVLQLLPTADNATIVSVLEEIVRYQDKYSLDSDQLDILLDIPIDDAEIVAAILSIFYDYVYVKKVEPKNQEKFKELLRAVVIKFKDEQEINNIGKLGSIFGLKDNPSKRNVYFTALKLLAKYNDNLVIDRFKADFSDPERKRCYGVNYFNGVFAKIFDDNTTDLFNFQIQLRNEGFFDAARDIGEIRDIAKRESFPVNHEQELKKQFRSGEGL